MNQFGTDAVIPGFYLIIQIKKNYRSQNQSQDFNGMNFGITKSIPRPGKSDL